MPLLAIAGMVYVAINSSPTPEMGPQILRYLGVVLGIFAVISGLWVQARDEAQAVRADRPGATHPF